MKTLSHVIRKLMPVTLAIIGLLAAVGCSGDSKDNPVSPDANIVPAAAAKAGDYATNYRWGGANGLWRGNTPLKITATGEVTYGTTKIINPTFTKDGLSWSMADGNHTNADVNFTDKNSSDFFWRDYGGVNKRNFTGWIQNPGEGKLDFRGLIQ